MKSWRVSAYDQTNTQIPDEYNNTLLNFTFNGLLLSSILIILIG